MIQNVHVWLEIYIDGKPQNSMVYAVADKNGKVSLLEITNGMLLDAANYSYTLTAGGHSFEFDEHHIPMGNNVDVIFATNVQAFDIGK